MPSSFTRSIAEDFLCVGLPIYCAYLAAKAVAKMLGFPAFDPSAPLTEEAFRCAVMWAAGCAIAIPTAIMARTAVGR